MHSDIYLFLVDNGFFLKKMYNCIKLYNEIQQKYTIQYNNNFTINIAVF
jgi:hypothetical protein